MAVILYFSFVGFSTIGGVVELSILHVSIFVVS